MIVTVTINPALDVFCETDRVEPDHKLRCSRPHRDPGGGGINVARGIRELGGDPSTVTAVWAGGGATGDLLGDLLAESGVEHRRIEIDGMTRENLTVRESSSEHQYRFTMPGAEVSEKEAEGVLAAIEELEPQYVVASGSLPPGLGDDWYARLAKFCAERDIKYVLDTSGEPLRRAAASGVWLLKPNLRELGTLADTEVESDRQAEQVAREVIDSGGAQLVVISLGAGGAVLVADGVCERIRAPTVPIRSKVGAGDSMVAGLVLAFDRGDSPLDAVRYGIAAGAAAVQTPGSGLCCKPDVERLFEEISNA